MLERQESARMHNVEPVGVSDHGERLQDENVPLVVGYGSAVVVVAARLDRFKGFNGAEDAAEEDEGRCAVESPADGEDVGGQHAGLAGAAVDEGNEADEDDFDNALQHQGNGDEHVAALALGLVVALGAGELAGSGAGEHLDEGAEVDEEVDDAAGVEGRVHGQVVHEAAEDVVFGGGVDGGSGEDEDRLNDEEGHVLVVFCAYRADEPA